MSIVNVVKHGLHVEAVIYVCCINVIISPELRSNNEDDPSLVSPDPGLPPADISCTQKRTIYCA